MVAILISLGANLGNPRESMHAAKRLLSDTFGALNIRCSQLFRTPPVGGPAGQGDFLNAVAAIQTDQSVWQVWETMKSIETTLGRQRQNRWEARRIDIDLILYGTQRIWTPHLKVPHPRMCMRTFVLSPACEVASDWIDPVTNWSIQQLADHLRSSVLNPIRVICPDLSIFLQLRQQVEQHPTDKLPVKLEWCLAPELCLVPPVELEWCLAPDSNLSQCLGPASLTIVAVASPDPMSVLWEDYSLAWATRLNLTANSLIISPKPDVISGPRYLMPANDLGWAAHEIHSAFQAMTCNIEPLEKF